MSGFQYGGTSRSYSDKAKENLDKIEMLKFNQDHRVYEKCDNCKYLGKFDQCKSCYKKDLWKFDDGSEG